MTDEHEERRTAALERLADRSAQLSGVTGDLLDYLKQETSVTAHEVATTATVDATLAFRDDAKRTWRTTAAVFLVGLVVGAAITDLHVHVAHLSVIEPRLAAVEALTGLPVQMPTWSLLPLEPRAGQPYLPIGPLAGGVALLTAAWLWWSARRLRNPARTDRIKE